MVHDDTIAIKVDRVSKDFRLPHQRNLTLKSSFLSMVQPHSKRTIETQHALKDVSFEIKKGEFFGIVGRNGSGKSTLLKMLAGIYYPNEGSIQVNGKLVPFIELGVGFNGELSGRENVYLNGALIGFSRKEIDDLYDEIVDFAELHEFMDQKLKNYSSGMQVRLAFSIATRAKSDILLVDEVLAVGDADFQRKCFNYFQKIKKAETTVVFVSHDMSAIREYCERAALIEKSELVAVDTAQNISKKYTQLFAKDTEAGQAGADSKRWGDHAAKYTKIQVKEVGKDKETLEIIVEAEATKDIDDPVFGFLIKNATGQPLVGTNTRIKQTHIGDLKRGERIRVKWLFPNVFSDGLHFIDIAINHHNGVDVADWWEEATTFTIFKEDRSPYAITPPVTLEIEKM
jgi:ABC-2 type transport system ATP-binding protein